jgi:hypothetical protein
MHHGPLRHVQQSRQALGSHLHACEAKDAQAAPLQPFWQDQNMPFQGFLARNAIDAVRWQMAISRYITYYYRSSESLPL